MQKALENVRRRLGNAAAELWRERFARIHKMPGSNRKFKEIARAATPEQLNDYLAEVRYALLFAGLGFQVELEPLVESGPDLGISRDTHSAYVEVQRYRQIYPGPPELSLSQEEDILQHYGDPERDIRKVIEKMRSKFRQLGAKDSVLAIWNDEDELEDLEVIQAVRELRQDAAGQIRQLPSGLSFVLYGSAWINSQQQLYCYPLRDSNPPHLQEWMAELENSSVNALVRRACQQ